MEKIDEYEKSYCSKIQNNKKQVLWKILQYWRRNGIKKNNKEKGKYYRAIRNRLNRDGGIKNRERI